MIRRRSLISLLGGAILLWWQPKGRANPHAAPTGSEPSRTKRCGSQLARLFSQPEDAREIGLAYLEHYPQRRNRNRLLSDSGLSWAELSTLPRADLKSQIRQRQIQDFARGETVIVRRWVLSRAEASVCALVALS